MAKARQRPRKSDVDDEFHAWDEDYGASRRARARPRATLDHEPIKRSIEVSGAAGAFLLLVPVLLGLGALALVWWGVGSILSITLGQLLLLGVAFGVGYVVGQKTAH